MIGTEVFLKKKETIQTDCIDLNKNLKKGIRNGD